MKKLLLLLMLITSAAQAQEKEELHISYIAKDTIMYVETEAAYIGLHLSAALNLNSDYDKEFKLIQDSLKLALYQDTGLYPMTDELNKTHVIAVNYVVAVFKEFGICKKRRQYKEQERMLKALAAMSDREYKKRKFRHYELAKKERKAIKQGYIETYVRNLVKEIRSENTNGYGEWKEHIKPKPMYNY